MIVIMMTDKTGNNIAALHNVASDSVAIGSVYRQRGARQVSVASVCVLSPH